MTYQYLERAFVVVISFILCLLFLCNFCKQCRKNKNNTLRSIFKEENPKFYCNIFSLLTLIFLTALFVDFNMYFGIYSKKTIKLLEWGNRYFFVMLFIKYSDVIAKLICELKANSKTTKFLHFTVKTSWIIYTALQLIPLCLIFLGNDMFYIFS